MTWDFPGADMAKGRTPVAGVRPLQGCQLPCRAACLTAYLRIRERSTYCMMPPLR